MALVLTPGQAARLMQENGRKGRKTDTVGFFGQTVPSMKAISWMTRSTALVITFLEVRFHSPYRLIYSYPLKIVYHL